MTVGHLTTFSISDIDTVSIRCRKCGATTAVSAAAPRPAVAFDSSDKGQPRRPPSPHPFAEVLDREAQCPCGAVLWPDPGESSPVRDFVRAMLAARRESSALSGVQLSISRSV